MADSRTKNIQEANQLLGEQINLMTQLADVLKNVVAESKTKSTLEKGSLDLSRQAVKLTRDLSSEYDSVEAVQKDITKNRKLQQDLEKQAIALQKQFGGNEEEILKKFKKKQEASKKADHIARALLEKQKNGANISDSQIKRAQDLAAVKAEEMSAAGRLLENYQEQITFLEEQGEILAENLAYLAEQERRQQNLVKSGSLVTDALNGTAKVFNELKMTKIGSIFSEGAKHAKKLTEEQTTGGKRVLTGYEKMKVAVQGIGKSLKAAFTFTNIMGAAVMYLVKLFKKQKERLKEGVDLANKQAQATADMGRNLGVSSAKAAELASQVSAIGGAMGMTTDQAKQAAGEILSSIGGVEKLTNDTMQTFMKLKKFAGMTADDVKNIYRLSKLTGQEAGKVAKEMGAQAQQSIKSLKLNVSMKQLMSDVGKVSANVKINFGGSAKAITAAVAQAKKLGLEMNQIEGIASSLLNIEDSIAAEMEAELLTGKDLNLEKARLAALNGDQAALMDELAAQGITEAEYSKMNVLQRESLAKAMGMTKDQMDGMLITQKENTASNQDQVDMQQKGIDAMMSAATILEARAAREEQLKGIGEEQTKNMNKLIDAGLKLKETLQPLVDAIFEPILELVTDIATFISDNLGGSIQQVSDGSGKVLRDFSNLKPIIKAIAVTYGLIKGYQAAITLKKKIAMGYDKIKKSDTLFFARYRMMEFKDTLALNAKKLAFYVKEKAQLLANKAIQAASFLKNVGIAAMKAISSLASIPVVGWGLGIAAAASVAALAAKYMNDGIQGPVTGGKPGYSRTMYSPEGAISFNDKDTIVAGTNLGGEGNSNSNSAELGKIANLLEKLLNKEGGVYIDGNKVGSTIALTNYEQQ